MKKFSKKLFSVVLSLSLVFVFSVSSYAAESPSPNASSDDFIFEEEDVMVLLPDDYQIPDGAEVINIEITDDNLEDFIDADGNISIPETRSGSVNSTVNNNSWTQLAYNSGGFGCYVTMSTTFDWLVNYDLSIQNYSSNGTLLKTNTNVLNPRSNTSATFWVASSVVQMKGKLFTGDPSMAILNPNAYADITTSW